MMIILGVLVAFTRHSNTLVKKYLIFNNWYSFVYEVVESKYRLSTGNFHDAIITETESVTYFLCKPVLNFKPHIRSPYSHVDFF